MDGIELVWKLGRFMVEVAFEVMEERWYEMSTIGELGFRIYHNFFEHPPPISALSVNSGLVSLSMVL